MHADPYWLPDEPYCPPDDPYWVQAERYWCDALDALFAIAGAP
ncbi:MAG TPA: hypothetical protein VNR59_13315 [Gaiellaceae bacterium]|nr:hypothetical protein [Gaiellaceae bacterium]